MISRPNFDYLQQALAKTSGLRFEPGSEYFIEARLLPLSRQLQASSVNDLIRKMQTGSVAGAEELLAEALTDLETSFFRDLWPFDMLKRNILPELKAKRADQHELSIWCAGCSTGQESYSIALILHDSFPELLNWKIVLLATDVSGDALRTAVEGRYNQLEINRGLPSALLVKFFQKEAAMWRIKDQVRHTVQYSSVNLCHEFPSLRDFDVIFLRNVLSSFTPELQSEILRKVRDHLHPDGYLVLGIKEAPVALNEFFVPVQFDKMVCYRPKADVAKADVEVEADEAVQLSSEGWSKLARLALRSNGANEIAQVFASNPDLQARLLRSARRRHSGPSKPAASVEEALPQTRKEQLMAISLGPPVANVVNETFTAMLSTGLEPTESTSKDSTWKNQLAATVKLSGAINGSLTLRMQPEFARTLVGTALGVAAEDVDPDVIKNTFQQLLQLIATSLKSSLATAGVTCACEAGDLVQTPRPGFEVPPRSFHEPLAFTYQDQGVLLDIVVTSIDANAKV